MAGRNSTIPTVTLTVTLPRLIELFWISREHCLRAETPTAKRFAREVSDALKLAMVAHINRADVNRFSTTVVTVPRDWTIYYPTMPISYANESLEVALEHSTWMTGLP